MTKKKPTKVAASVRARLLQLAKQGGEDFHYVLTRYGLERFLVRLVPPIVQTATRYPALLLHELAQFRD